MVVNKRSTYKQGTKGWFENRQRTIASSRVALACQQNDNFISADEFGSCYTPGIAIEEVMTKIFDKKLIEGYQIISQDDIWLSATPDAFFADGTPVEVKTTQVYSLKEAISENYHQM